MKWRFVAGCLLTAAVAQAQTPTPTPPPNCLTVNSSAEAGFFPRPSQFWNGDGALAIGISGSRVRWVFYDGLLLSTEPTAATCGGAAWCARRFRVNTAPISAISSPLAATWFNDTQGWPIAWLDQTAGQVALNVPVSGTTVRHVAYPGSVWRMPTTGQIAVAYVDVQDLPPGTIAYDGSGIAFSGDNDVQVASRVEGVFTPSEITSAGGNGFTLGGLISGGYLYFYATKGIADPGQFIDHWDIRLARVPCTASACTPEVRASYTFYSNGSWSSDINLATPIITGALGGPQMAVTYSTEAQKFLMVYDAINLRDNIVDKMLVRVSDTPWGPWSQESVLYNERASQWPTSLMNYAANIVEVLSGGTTLATTYYNVRSDLFEAKTYLMYSTIDGSACRPTPTPTVCPTCTPYTLGAHGSCPGGMLCCGS